MPIHITINTAILKQLFNQVLKPTGGLNRNKMISLRATYERLELIVQGAVAGAKAEVKGEGDIILPTKLLKAYVDTCSTVIISFEFKKGSLHCGSSIYETSAIDIVPLGLRPDAEIPINPTRESILRYALTQKDDVKIATKGLSTTVKSARLVLKRDIQSALAYLEKYGVTHDELEQLISQKLVK